MAQMLTPSQTRGVLSPCPQSIEIRWTNVLPELQDIIGTHHSPCLIGLDVRGVARSPAGEETVKRTRVDG